MRPAIPVLPVDQAPPRVVLEDDTMLAQWGMARRGIHRLCRRSRTFNTVVAAVEMRLGREELLSLPQYMSLCPTGQCNALCDFCSVTRNRTGIIKKQLPFDALLRFTRPVARVIRMYGLEGNGEPTLYERFDELADALLRNGSTAYLITNGDRLTPASIDALVARGLDAVNFSLNAATAPTHRRVMKLKDFDRVLRNIRYFVQARGSRRKPVISISMVVTHDSVHEVADFIRLGEQDLGVDRVLVRPLSEIATELGAIEDVRPLVPFESEIADMLEAVRDYMRFAPRRAEIDIQPANFKAVRPDPPGEIVLPPGLEQRLLAPRPSWWRVVGAAAQVDWSWNALRVRSSEGGRLLESAPIPVVPGGKLLFRCRAAAVAGDLTIAIGIPGGQALAAAHARSDELVELWVETGTNQALAVWIDANGPVDARLEFDRLRTPAAVRSDRFVLPHQGRWEIANADVRIEWNQSRVRVHGPVIAGPYLLKSYSAWCTPGSRVSITPEIDVSIGSLGVGVLSADQERWLTTYTFPAGTHGAASIDFDSGANDRVHVVLYGAATGALDATVDWGGTLEPLPARRSDSADVKPRTEPRSIVGDLALHAPTPASHETAPPPRPATFAERLSRALRGEVRYYCQKPWTDLHNFTVDGRMDVCCIATGASQERFALGNLTTQPFQAVWNGPRAREFRRTVNSGSPLPPCRRCPMAFAYQGPLFNPAGAERRVRRALAVTIGKLPFGAPLYRAASRAIPPIVSFVFFRGFKR